MVLTELGNKMGRLTMCSQHQMGPIFLPNRDYPCTGILVFSFCIFGSTIVLVREEGGQKIFVGETKCSGESCKIHLGSQNQRQQHGYFHKFY